jgi:hypothetical protein
LTSEPSYETQQADVSFSIKLVDLPASGGAEL